MGTGHNAAARPYAAHGTAPGCRCGAPSTLAAFARIKADISRRRMAGGAGAMMGLFAAFGLSAADDAVGREAQRPTLPLAEPDGTCASSCRAAAL